MLPVSCKLTLVACCNACRSPLLHGSLKIVDILTWQPTSFSKHSKKNKQNVYVLSDTALMLCSIISTESFKLILICINRFKVKDQRSHLLIGGLSENFGACFKTILKNMYTLMWTCNSSFCVFIISDSELLWGYLKEEWKFSCCSYMNYHLWKSGERKLVVNVVVIFIFLIVCLIT